MSSSSRSAHEPNLIARLLFNLEVSVPLASLGLFLLVLLIASRTLIAACRQRVASPAASCALLSPASGAVAPVRVAGVVLKQPIDGHGAGRWRRHLDVVIEARLRRECGQQDAGLVGLPPPARSPEAAGFALPLRLGLRAPRSSILGGRVLCSRCPLHGAVLSQACAAPSGLAAPLREAQLAIIALEKPLRVAHRPGAPVDLLVQVPPHELAVGEAAHQVERIALVHLLQQRLGALLRELQRLGHSPERHLHAVHLASRRWRRHGRQLDLQVLRHLVSRRRLGHSQLLSQLLGLVHGS
mmetsp:Transcript_5012/g.20029  ORF Transcript_5012/g.20029 Transcript_5012/m.20029 type:complete len:298 (+) Transcript_5012:174-1067(+)